VSTPSNSAKKPASLGVIFLTLYIDLIGFSIIFPLLPDLLNHYLSTDGQSGLLGAMLEGTHRLSHLLGRDSNFAAVLFGGFLASFFSLLQFLFAPLWGGLSDRIGRRPVLVWTVLGTTLGYLVWILSGSFWLLVLSRILCGAFGGNLSVATAAVADVSSRADRSKAMGLVGAAFGLGLVTGPTIGALTVHWNLAASHPQLAAYGINPFSVPAMIAFSLSLVNLLWIRARFNETLPPEARKASREHRWERNALKAILGLENASVRRANLVAFIFSTAFVSMELSLTYLAAERFGYTARQNGMLLAFLGFCSIMTQGVIVRRMLGRMSELRVLSIGLVCSVIGFLGIGFASVPWMLYLALVFTAMGSGLVNPSTSGLISLYAGADEQGRVLGIFRSLGALSRAVTPVLAGLLYWSLGSKFLYVLSAITTVATFYLARTLPQPQK